MVFYRLDDLPDSVKTVKDVAMTELQGTIQFVIVDMCSDV